jgi:P pilus assembly chaperone PapD
MLLKLFFYREHFSIFATTLLINTYTMDRLYKNSVAKYFSAFACIFLLGTLQVQAQVSISPTALFFDSQNPFSSLTVSNGGEQAQEISISLGFSFPTSQNGNVLISEDSLLAEKKSIASNINVFPKNFTLEPQQRQLVRFVLQPPQGIADGGYWARVTITSNPVSQAIEDTDNAGGVGTQINIVLNQVISAHYRTNNAQTAVEVNAINFNTPQGGGPATVALSMEQVGNAPFVGSLSMQINDASGETVYQTNATTSVYTTITRTFPVDTSDWEPGTYIVTGQLTSQRRDIAAERLLQIQPLSFNKQITIE